MITSSEKSWIWLWSGAGFVVGIIVGVIVGIIGFIVLMALISGAIAPG
jgi:hypothetical protein